MIQIFPADKGHYYRMSSFLGKIQLYLSEAKSLIFTALTYQQVKGEIDNSKLKGWLESENRIRDTVKATNNTDIYDDSLRIQCGGSLGRGCE